MKSKSFSVLILLLVLSSLFPITSYGDVYTKEKTHVDEVVIMGQTQPAQDLVVETWITPDMVSVEDKNSKTILDLNKGTITTANHREKTIMTLPLNFSEVAHEKGKDLSKEEKENFKKVMNAMMKMDINIQVTDEYKKIGEWKCQKYIQTINSGMGAFRSEIWATEDIEIDPDVYAKYVSSFKISMPGMDENMKDILRETKKIKGVQVYIEQTNEIMGQSIRSTSELVEFREGQAPASAFKMPAGYKSETF